MYFVSLKKKLNIKTMITPPQKKKDKKRGNFEHTNLNELINPFKPRGISWKVSMSDKIT